MLYDVLVGLVSKNAAPTTRFKSSATHYDPEFGKRHPLRILVAEDNLVNQKVASSILEKIGYRADVVANGLEVLDALRRESYDVILMDGQMPEMDGEQATLRIRSRWPKEQQPRIIAMTANAMQGDRERYLAIGMDDYISKPIRIEYLIRALNHSQPIEHPANAARAASQAPEVGLAMDPKALTEFQEMMGEDGPEVVKTLVNLYREDSPKLIGEMRKSILEQDAATLDRSTHTLKGNSNQMGAFTLAGLCFELEKIGKAKSVEGGEALIEKIEGEFVRVSRALEAFIRL